MSPATRAHRTQPSPPPPAYGVLLAAAAVTEVRGNPGPGQAVETRHEQCQRISRTLLEAANELASADDSRNPHTPDTSKRKENQP